MTVNSKAWNFLGNLCYFYLENKLNTLMLHELWIFFFTTGEKLGDCITNAFFPLIMSTFDGKASSLVTYEPALRPDTLSYILCYI